jgi:phosphoribosylanthranilate isomerase
VAEVKFCGLTRTEDARIAAELGAAYAGVIFAGGPRLLDPARARSVFAGLAGTRTRRAGVFGSQSVDEVARIADEVALDVVQLHSGATVDRLLELHQRFGGEIWAVVAVGSEGVGDLSSLLPHADAIVLDTSVGGRSGGTGQSFDWRAAAAELRPTRQRMRLVVAGGLTPASVAGAITVLAPDVVDVSSGVEVSPGIKDPALMRAFAAAARPREE